MFRCCVLEKTINVFEGAVFDHEARYRARDVKATVANIAKSNMRKSKVIGAAVQPKAFIAQHTPTPIATHNRLHGRTGSTYATHLHRSTRVSAGFDIQAFTEEIFTLISGEENFSATTKSCDQIGNVAQVRGGSPRGSITSSPR
ncbi:MAG: hypothetical protein HY054_01140 [Proteobacteria bacterium]|nr:hypothetical protein [Pseudomonadota bacterium]